MSTQTSIEDFEALQLVMKDFSAQIERKLTDKRAQLISEKQEHYIRVNELRSEEIKLQNDIANLKVKETKTKENLSGAIDGLRAQRTKVDELISKEEELVQLRNALQSQVGELSESIKSSTQELDASQKNLQTQIRRDYPELLKFEQYLGLRIEAVSVDLIKFVFVNIDPSNFEREFSIDLGVGSEDYIVGSTSPELSSETSQKLQHELNLHKEVVRFLKSAREAFKELV